MTTSYQRLEVNCETGQQTIVPLTEEEIAERLSFEAEVEAGRAFAEAEAKAKAEAKTAALAKLTALGLTEEEAKAIAG